jgi:hypothetical protein
MTSKEISLAAKARAICTLAHVALDSVNIARWKVKEPLRWNKVLVHPLQ